MGVRAPRGGIGADTLAYTLPARRLQVTIPFPCAAARGSRRQRRGAVMGEGQVTGKDLIALGFQSGPAMGLALRAVPAAEAALGAEEVARRLRSLAADPRGFVDDPYFGEVAMGLLLAAAKPTYVEREAPAP